jgi:hypothetical protein
MFLVPGATIEEKTGETVIKKNEHVYPPNCFYIGKQTVLFHHKNH